ncbi:MAG: hypothetical protein AB7H90_16110 [Alphaproteobacteria bacterium]
MSDASPARELGPPRPLRGKELALVKKLLAGTRCETKARAQLDEASVQDMPDGGMGSIRFVQGTSEERMFGEEIAEGLFHDADGVPVSVGLNIDQFDDLFELDLWKVDFSPLIRYPDANDIEIIERHGKLGFPPDGLERDNIGSKREG